MNHADECRDRREAIAALVMGELDGRSSAELERHIARCETCRGVRDALAEEETSVRSGFEALARAAKPASRAFPDVGRSQRQPRAPAAAPTRLLRGVKEMIFAHKRMSAAAVVAAAAMVLAFLALASYGTRAYALDQTTQANRRVQYFHVKITPAAGGLGEAWAQLDADGNVVKMRMDFPEPPNGPKVSVLSCDKAEVWFKDKNFFVTFRDKSAMERFGKMRATFDPKLAFEQLQADKAAGKVEVETQEPSKAGEPIALTVTTKDSPNRKDVYLVDPATKLVEQIVKYRREEGKWEAKARHQYLDYNKPVDPNVFQPDLPKDVVRIDQTTGTLGLPKGEMKDEEIATKVAREFFEALIAKDYKKAGQIAEGMPEEAMKKGAGSIVYLRIVEIGKPTPHPDPETRFLQVPVKVEIEKDGKKEVHPFTLNIRSAYNQPDRWVVGGGF
jgi:hypothetical protein